MLGGIVEMPVLAVFHTGPDFAHRRPIAFQLIRDDYPRHIGQPLQQLTEKPLRRILLPLALYEDIEDMAVLVDGAPQRVPLAVDGEKDVIRVLLVSWPGMPTPYLIGVCLPKLSTPIPHSLVSQDDATCGHQLIEVPVAQADAKIQPDAVADDLRREPMALVQVGRGWCVHGASMSHGTGAGQVGR
jgi:hypothetical protein